MIDKSADAEIELVDINAIVQHWLGHSNYRKITILKIDVGGSEFNVLRSSLPLFRAKRVINAIVEVTPSRANELTDYVDMIAIINAILDAGYILTSTFNPHDSANLTYLSEFLHPHSSLPRRNEPHLYLFTMVRKSLQVSRSPISALLRAAVLSLSPLAAEASGSINANAHMNLVEPGRNEQSKENNGAFQANIKFSR
jgi:hypothetical protein